MAGSRGRDRFRTSWKVALGVVVGGALLGAAAMMLSPAPSYLVGAYYYGWYDTNHRNVLGYLGPHLPEPLEPALGEYQSTDPRVVDTHLRWASDFGIDFLILSFSGQGTTSDRQAREVLLPALSASPVRQAPVVETLAYGEGNLLDPDTRRRFLTDIRYLGEHYLSHPSAMRVDSRPLLFFYVTRVVQGNIAELMAEVRRELKATGIDPFIVGDEVFWQSADAARLRAFDAVTPYNVYDWPKTQHRGWASDTTFFEDVDRLFARWQATADAAGVVFVPNAMPGYNDRGVRLEEDHFVIPRLDRPGGAKTGFFERSIELAKRYVDPDLRLVTITSFNEWHEWTQVEPARATGRPPAADAAVYTQEYPHPAYEFEYLRLILDEFGPAGSP